MVEFPLQKGTQMRGLGPFYILVRVTAQYWQGSVGGVPVEMVGGKFGTSLKKKSLMPTVG